MDGRLRVKIPETKRSASKALAAEQVIRSLPGVSRVAANPITGNVLVLFDSAQLTHDEILSALVNAGYLREQICSPTFQFAARIVVTVSHAVARSLAEALMERAILALL
jgi:copper chaperone CopZ